MSRSRRLLLCLAGAAFSAFPLLWTPSSWLELRPPAVGLGWLLAACLIGLGPPLKLPELTLLAVIMTPGLFVTLTAHADLNIPEAYAFAARLLLAVGLYAALSSLAELIGAGTPRALTRFALALAVPVVFALGLGSGSLLLSIAVTAFGWAALKFIRSMRSRG